MVARVGHGGGVNCTLSYSQTDGKVRAYRLRAVKLVHGLQMIATEGKSRTGRAYYPHERAAAQFMITFALLARKKTTDHAEYERFNVWLREYMNRLLDLDSPVPNPSMLIDIPTRRFHRHGIPLGPVQFGEQVGSMVWYQTITFETTYEPKDKKPALSTFDFNGTGKDRNARYFYPRSVQLAGNEKPTVYDGVNVVPVDPAALGTTPSAGAVQGAVYGTPPAPAPTNNNAAIQAAQAAYAASAATLGIQAGEI